MCISSTVHIYTYIYICILYTYIYIYIAKINLPSMTVVYVYLCVFLFNMMLPKKVMPSELMQQVHQNLPYPLLMMLELKLNRFDQKNNSLVVEPTPLKNMSSSIGIFLPNWMEKSNMLQTTKMMRTSSICVHLHTLTMTNSYALVIQHSYGSHF